MIDRRALILERNARRDETAQRVAAACKRGGVSVLSTGGNGSNVFVVEDANGTQYTVTVSRRRTQESA